MSNPSALSTVVNVFASPNEAFTAIKERQRAWLPLLILFVGICTVSMLYLHKVDLRWLIDSQIAQGLRQSNAQLTDEQRQKAVETALRLSPAAYGAIGASVSSLFVLLLVSVSALYYTVVSFFTDDGVAFKQWFGLVAWCTLPAVIGIGAQIVNLLVSDARFMPQDALNPLAFGNLLSIDRTGATIVQRILLGIDFTGLWSLVLTVLAYQAWTKSSFGKTLGVVLSPWIVIIAIGTAVAFLR